MRQFKKSKIDRIIDNFVDEIYFLEFDSVSFREQYPKTWELWTTGFTRGEIFRDQKRLGDVINIYRYKEKHLNTELLTFCKAVLTSFIEEQLSAN